MRTIFLFFVFAILSFSGRAHSKLGPTHFQSLKSSADLIAFVKVVEIHTRDGLVVAEAELLKDAYKGRLRKGDTIAYVLTRTIGCDISKAKVNEHSILFLSDLTSLSKLRPRNTSEIIDAVLGAETPRFRITRFGRGRIRVLDGMARRGRFRWSFGKELPLAKLEPRLR